MKRTARPTKQIVARLPGDMADQLEALVMRSGVLTRSDVLRLLLQEALRDRRIRNTVLRGIRAVG